MNKKSFILIAVIILLLLGIGWFMSLKTEPVDQKNQAPVMTTQNQNVETQKKGADTTFNSDDHLDAALEEINYLE